MKDHIHKVGGMLMFTHLLITDDKLLFGLDTLKTVEAFHEEYNREGKMKAIKAISIDTISNVEFNESDGVTKITYTTDKGKTKTKKISFDQKELSNVFGDYLGQERQLKREVKDEKKWLVLLGNVALMLLVLGGLIYLLDVDNFNSYLIEEESNTRSGRKRAFYKTILSMLGHKGTLGILGFATLFAGYSAFSEFKKPAKVISYS